MCALVLMFALLEYKKQSEDLVLGKNKSIDLCFIDALTGDVSMSGCCGAESCVISRQDHPTFGILSSDEAYEGSIMVSLSLPCPFSLKSRIR